MNTTPAWFEGVPTAVEIEARSLASVLRFHGQGEPVYASAMHQLVNMITNDQHLRKDQAECPGSANVSGAANPLAGRTRSAAGIAGSKSPAKSSGSTAPKSSPDASAAPTAARKRTRRKGKE